MPALNQREASYRWLKNLRIRLLRHWGSTCNWNGCAESREWTLEFAHLEPTGLKGSSRGKRARLKDVRNNPDKYTVLCYECHRAYDYRSLLPDFIPQPTERGPL